MPLELVAFHIVSKQAVWLGGGKNQAGWVGGQTNRGVGQRHAPVNRGCDVSVQPSDEFDRAELGGGGILEGDEEGIYFKIRADGES